MAQVTRPTMVDDSGLFTDGTAVDKAFIDAILDEVDDQVHSTTNPTVKPKATTDEVVAARGNLASLGARLDGVVDADGNPVAAAGQATETQLSRAEGNFNLVSNPDLEDWAAGASAAPDHFTLSGAAAAIARTGDGEVDTQDLGTGTYAAKITSGGGAAAKLTQAIITAAAYTKYRSLDGRKVGFTLRAKVANSNVLRIVVDDGATTTASSYASGSASEQDISVVHTMSASATKLDIYAEVALGTNTAYVGGFTVVVSDLAPLWTPLWAKFRQDLVDEVVPTQFKIGGVPKTVSASGVLLSSITQSTKSANGETFYTITVPGGTLENDGDCLRLSMYFAAENTTGQNICPFVQFGATAPTVASVGSGAISRFKLEVIIQRTGAATQLMIQSHTFVNATAGSSVAYQPAAVTPAETLSGDVAIAVKLQATGTRSVVAYGYILEFLPAVA